MKRFTTRVSFTVPKGTKAILKARAAQQGISMSKLIRRITSKDDLAALAR
jgi:Ribbon-helix-helix protein, copG family